MRLASFETITNLTPIEGKTSIELAEIQGYNVVVLIDDFQVGDTCVYIPIDTVVDKKNSWFTFLKSNRINTKMIGGEWSQGLAIPLSKFGDVIPNPKLFSEEELESLDIGSLIGVTKYEKDLSKSNGNSPFPEFPTHYIPITDEEPLKGCKKLLKELVGKEVDVTKKMDGSSMTLIWDGDIFMISSRRCSLYKIDGNEVEFEFNESMVRFAKSFREKFRGKNITIQGEFCGPKVNGNKLKLNKHEWYVFTVKDGDRYYGYDELYDFCEDNKFWIVPLVATIEVTDETTVGDFQDIANGVKYGNDLGEGVVVRPKVPYLSKVLGYKNASFKVINIRYKD